MNAARETLGQSIESDPVLAELVEEITNKIQAGEPVDLSRIEREHPEQMEQLHKLLPAIEVLAELKGSAVTQATSGQPMEEALGPQQGVLGDYRIIREIGCGGMGVVYEAQQVSLGRKVALKVLPFAAMLDQRQLQRFKSEAHAAAQLHHTNIVPVYSVGCERGVHYYAMQYIEGHPLSAVIRELRQLSGLDPSDQTEAPSAASETASSLVLGEYLPTGLRTLAGSSADAGLGTDSVTGPLGITPSVQSIRSSIYFRSAARLGVQAAEALEHAHQQGIVHRDIKPSNLLLDTQGHLWITDFGLAHCQTDTIQTLTVTGDLVGTIRYMSPEQALGERTMLDHRTDIYSLGLTLYELLTLEPAFAGQERHQLLARLVEEDVRSPRQLNDAIPADLETIVLKATGKEPGARYDTAQELADDLRRFLENKPIKAKPPTLLDRATKWCRRHRSVVVAAVALLVMSVIGLTASTVLVVREKGKTDTALAQAQLSFQTAERQRLRAEENFENAREAVDKMLTEAAETLAGVPHMQKARRSLLEDALSFYQGFLTQRSDDPVVRSEAGRAYRRVGEINALLGQEEQAEESCTQAITLFEDLVADFPDEPDYQKELARTSGLLGKLLWRVGRAQEGEAPCRRALTIWNQLAAAFPNEPEYRSYYGIALNDLGLVLSRTGRREEAETSYRQSLDVSEKLNAAFPDEPDYRAELARAHNNLGTVLAKDEKEAAYRQAITIQEKLVAGFSTKPEYKESLARYLNNLGNVLQGVDSLQEAEEVYPRVLALREELASDFPSVPGYQEELFSAHRDRATLLGNRGQPQEARKARLRAAEILRKLAAEFPNKPIYREQLGYSLRAVSANRESIAVMEELAAEFPEVWRYRWELMWGRNNLGWRLYEQRKELKTAAQLFRQNIAFLEGPVEDFPNEAHRRYRLSVSCRALGMILTLDGTTAEAEEMLRKALDIAQKLVAEYPEVSAYRNQVAASYSRLSNALLKAGRREEAAQSYLKAFAIDEKRLTDLPEDQGLARLVEGYGQLGVMLLQTGQADEHLDRFRRAAALHANLPESAHYAAANPCLTLGVLLFETGLTEEAKQVFRQDLTLLEKQCSDAANEAAPYEKLARLLVVCPDPELHDPARAAELAGKAVELEPRNGSYWHTLGKARYRLGDWQAALEAQEKSVELAGRATSWNMFYLAMAHWQMGNKDQAHNWYEGAVKLSPALYSNGEIYRLEIEATKLLSIDKQETEEEESGED